MASTTGAAGRVALARSTVSSSRSLCWSTVSTSAMYLSVMPCRRCSARCSSSWEISASRSSACSASLPWRRTLRIEVRASSARWASRSSRPGGGRPGRGSPVPCGCRRNPPWRRRWPCASSTRLPAACPRSRRLPSLVLAHRADPGADRLAAHCPADVPIGEQVEHDDGQVVVVAQRQGGGVHHLELAPDRLQVVDAQEAAGLRVLPRVGLVDPVDPVLGQEDDLGADL